MDTMTKELSLKVFCICLVVCLKIQYIDKYLLDIFHVYIYGYLY